jgi:hypothetical protein
MPLGDYSPKGIQEKGADRKLLNLDIYWALLSPGMNLCVAAEPPRTNSYRQSATPWVLLVSVPFSYISNFVAFSVARRATENATKFELP